MKTPKFTDTHRYARPYKHSTDTNITRTFSAETKRQKELEVKKEKSNVRDFSDVFKAQKHG